mgnify:FL=1
MGEFTHFDSEGKAIMVDIGDKPTTDRVARAEAKVFMTPETLRMIKDGEHKKGDVLGVARIAGIMAAKHTSDLIPLCHPLQLTSVHVDAICDSVDTAVIITATCKLSGRTGVEMEALTAVSVAALTVYDMCKSVDREITITDVRLLQKSGGKSGTFKAVTR